MSSIDTRTTSRRAARFARVAAIGFVLTVLVGVLVPVYTDEIGWRFQLARSTIDGGVDRGMGEQCGLNSIVRAPMFMQPLRHVSGWLYAAAPTPLAIRLSGVVMALAWAAMLWRLAGRLPDGLRHHARSLGFALAGLGVLPFLMVWSRPEAPILLALTGAVSIALDRGAREGGVGGAWARAAAITALGGLALGYHPKAVPFLLVALAALAVSSRGRGTLAPRLTGGVLLGWMGIVAYLYWRGRLACPGDAVLARQFGRENLASLIGQGISTAAFLRAALLAANPLGYLDPALPHIHAMSDWLPAMQTPYAPRIFWQAIVAWHWIVAGLSLAAAALTALIGAWRGRGLPRAAPPAIAISVAVLAWGATQLNKNAYESALVLPLLIVALVVALRFAPGWIARRLGAFARPAVIASILSQLALIALYAPALARIDRTPGFTRESSLSISPFGFGATRTAILAAGRACGVDPARSRPRYLLVDDLTALAYADSYRPFHHMAVTGLWHGTVTDPLAYLRARRSSGVVMQCRALPAGMRAQATASGDYCCIGLGR